MSISGTWFNELGSKMQITASGGGLYGSYHSAVGDVKAEYTLEGRYNTQPASGGQALGWAVAWTNAYGTANSATTWSGQYQTDAEGEELYTLWLLASEQVPEEDWQSTLVGQDTFRRGAPSPEAVERARRRSPGSSPTSRLDD